MLLTKIRIPDPSFSTDFELTIENDRKQQDEEGWGKKDKKVILKRVYSVSGMHDKHHHVVHQIFMEKIKNF